MSFDKEAYERTILKIVKITHEFMIYSIKQMNREIEEIINGSERQQVMAYQIGALRFLSLEAGFNNMNLINDATFDLYTKFYRTEKAKTKGILNDMLKIQIKPEINQKLSQIMEKGSSAMKFWVAGDYNASAIIFTELMSDRN